MLAFARLAIEINHLANTNLNHLNFPIPIFANILSGKPDMYLDGYYITKNEIYNIRGIL